MSTLTKTRRMPAKYCVRPGGVTEIIYNATPEVVVVLPRTRWLEVRREREARFAALRQEAVTRTPVTARTFTFRCEVPEPAAGTAAATTCEPIEPGTEIAGASTEAETSRATMPFETELTSNSDDEGATEADGFGDEQAEPLSWTEQMRIATTKLIRRQSVWFSSMRGEAPISN